MNQQSFFIDRLTNSTVRYVFVLVILIALVSCMSSKRLTEKSIYFRGLTDEDLAKIHMAYEPKIQRGDILYIGVFTPNEKSSQLFNQPNFYAGTERVSGGSGALGSPTQGYLVDNKGEIAFPVLGKILVAGMTKSQLGDSISRRLATYIDSAIVSVRLLNYRITVLGEVNNPGTFSIPSERVTILDALGMAGDLTIYGKRDNVRIIRNAADSLSTETIDLNSGAVFSSPYFYLQPNDVVYVEMNSRKITNTDMADFRRISMILGVLSAVGVVISIINAIN